MKRSEVVDIIESEIEAYLNTKNPYATPKEAAHYLLLKMEELGMTPPLTSVYVKVDKNHFVEQKQPVWESEEKEEDNEIFN